MASKMGNLKQWQLRENVTSTDHKNIQAEMSGDPIIGHNVSTGDRSDFDIGDASSGSVGHVVKDIFQRENNRVVILDSSGAIVKIINLSEFEGQMQGILSGKSKTSGFPDFLQAGGGTNQWVKILGATTSLELTIDGSLYRLTSDLQKSSLGLAPGSNNTCLVNDTNIVADPIWSKTIGEYGYWVAIDTIGSEITSLNGTVQCFKINNGVDDEIFIATVDTTNNRLIPILRGIGGTDRIAFSNNDTITLLKAHYVFLDDNLTTVDTTINYLTWGYAFPSSPVTGDYHQKTSDKKWYRYSGTAWEALGRMYLGYAICDSAGCKWVEHDDYSLNWSSLLYYRSLEKTGGTTSTTMQIIGEIRVSVAGKTIIGNGGSLDLTSDYFPGEASVSNSWGYIYLTKNGELFLSHVVPRNPSGILGYYHPKEYYRCIGVFYVRNTGASDFTAYWTYYPGRNSGNGSVIILQSTPGISLPTGFYPISPPMASAASIIHCAAMLTIGDASLSFDGITNLYFNPSYSCSASIRASTNKFQKMDNFIVPELGIFKITGTGISVLHEIRTQGLILNL